MRLPGLLESLGAIMRLTTPQMQFKLLTSWALVADVYFLPPQQMQEGESAVDFAQRVQKMIADVAQLRIVPWDGYLKYYNLASKVLKPNLHAIWTVLCP